MVHTIRNSFRYQRSYDRLKYRRWHVNAREGFQNHSQNKYKNIDEENLIPNKLFQQLPLTGVVFFFICPLLVVDRYLNIWIATIHQPPPYNPLHQPFHSFYKVPTMPPKIYIFFFNYSVIGLFLKKKKKNLL